MLSGEDVTGARNHTCLCTLCIEFYLLYVYPMVFCVFLAVGLSLSCSLSRSLSLSLLVRTLVLIIQRSQRRDASDTYRPGHIWFRVQVRSTPSLSSFPPSSLLMSRPPQAAAEGVVSIRKTPGGPGQQYEVKWQGQTETTWEAASRVRKQIPLLVQAFEQQQQQQQAAPHRQQEGATDGDDAPMLQAVVVPGVDSSMSAQMAALEQLVRDQAQQLQQLRASPAHSPQHSAQASPQLSPQASPQQSRFARKEPRAQDLREYDGASGAKLDEWLQELALATDLYELNAREAVKFATSRLRGAALQWWLAQDTSERTATASAALLAAALRTRFQPVTAARVAREQLDKLLQGSRHVNDYIADFQRLRTLLPSMAEEDALHAFERGLRRDLAEKLRVQGVTTLREAIAMAARVGGLTPAQSSTPLGRAASGAYQMEVDYVDGAAMEDRITQSVLNALQSQSASNSGLSGRTQTQRGNSEDRRGGFHGRGGARGGRGGRFGGRGVMTYTIPGRWWISGAPLASASAAAAAIIAAWSARMFPHRRSSQTNWPGAGEAPAAHGVAGARAQPSRTQRASNTQQL